MMIIGMINTIIFHHFTEQVFFQDVIHTRIIYLIHIIGIQVTGQNIKDIGNYKNKLIIIFFRYDSDVPYFYRRWYSPSYNYYTWYRSYPHYTALRDATTSSFANGLELYRNGKMTYDCLSRYWLTPSYWDRRYRYWTDLTPISSYTSYYTPSYYQRRARELYLTY